jgi:twinkle protein
MTYKATHQPCEACGSKDARATYDSGVSICFSCGAIDAPGGKAEVNAEFIIGEFRALNKRGISEETCRRYGYAVGTDSRGTMVQIAPYYDVKTGRLVAQKTRTATKEFKILGNGKKIPLFGLQLARRGGKMIIITEGEIDAMSISQAMGNTWPAVSLPNGGGTLDALQASLEFLETYEKVILAFDNDEVGKVALEAALELFSPGKAHVLELGTYKDANEMLQDGGAKGLRTAVWEAKQYRPDGIVDLVDWKERIEAPLAQGTPYPWPKLNGMVFGYRPGELITWTAGTGVGKTALIGELEHHLLTTTQEHIGIIHLEEGVVRSARRIIGIEMGSPIHLPDATYTQGAFDNAFEATIGTGRLHAYDHFGTIEIEVLLNRVRHLVRGSGCGVVVLDHISMVVSGADLDADERRMLDQIVTRLKTLAVETNVSIHIISHLSRGKGTAHELGGQVALNQLRGTQAIGQLSDTIIAAERNQQADTEQERNTTNLRVLKNRYAGITGMADSLLYDRTTGRMSLTTAPGEHNTTFGEDY